MLSQGPSDQSVLHQLASTAGLSVHWQNFRDQPQTVAPATLIRVLGALGIPAETEDQCRDSLQRLSEERQQEPPGMLVSQVNEELHLPASLGLKGQENLLARHEDGREFRLICLPQDGGVRVKSPADAGYYQLDLGHRELTLAVAPSRCTSVSDLCGNDRQWAVAAQIYSLRRRHDGGLGDFSALREFAETMARRGAAGVAVSPVHALFSADHNHYSPYSPSSRLFTNVLYIDPEQTFSRELIDACLQAEQLSQQHQQLEHLELIDWAGAARVKLSLLRALWAQNQAELMDQSGPLGLAFKQFREVQGEALELHAIFETLHAHHLARDSNAWHWRSWKPEFRDHASPAVKEFAEQHRQEVMFHCFLQWLADRGLAEAHQRCRNAGAPLGLIADLAVGTDSGGSHAWSRQSDMLTGLSIGAPPDMLNHQGQDWGLTSFSPHALIAHRYAPFLEMLRAVLRHAGGLRIDHILGMRRLWLIPEGSPPDQGAYLHFPQRDLVRLIALESWRHRAVIVGEDLGTIPDNFRQELAEAGLLGMGVLWFEKDHGYFIDPARWRSTAIATTSTHDLPTVAGWWRSRDIEWNTALNRLPEGQSPEQARAERNSEQEALWGAFRHAGLTDEDKPAPDNPGPVIDKSLAFIASTPAPLALAPIEDLLGLEQQVNLPGTIDEHPNWRRRLPVRCDELANHAELNDRLALLAQFRGATLGGDQQVQPG